MKRKIEFRWMTFLVAMCLAALSGQIQAYTKVPLSGFSPTGISADGTTVVGWGATGAVKWTQATGAVPIGAPTLSDFPDVNWAGISTDGSTVVYQHWDWSFGPTSFSVWTAATGLVDVPQPEPAPDQWGPTVVEVRGISADGSFVAGNSNIGAFVWMAATGYVPLVTPDNPLYELGFNVIGLTGSTVVGYTDGTGAFSWRADTGIVAIGALPGASSTLAAALGTSPNGSAIVGTSFNALSYWEAFLWTEATGMIGLGYLAGSPTEWETDADGNPLWYSAATAVSSNGTVVVGQSQSSTISQAFVWTPTTGMVGLGEDTMPLALSADGSIILCNGATGAFLLTTNAPAPTSAQLLQNLIADVDHINLARGIQNSLDAKLTNALDALDAHSEGFRLDTIGKLQAFINEVNAQRNKKITGADADHLIAEANNVIAKLNS